MRSLRNTDAQFEVFNAGNRPPAGLPPQTAVSKTLEPFRLGSKFWELVNSDCVFREELDRVVGEKTNTRFETLRREVEQRWKEQESQRLQAADRRGREEGFEFGKREGYESASQARNAEITHEIERLCRVTQAVMEAQEKALNAHQPVWLEALQLILSKCLVPRAAEITDQISYWLSHELIEFNRSKKIKVEVSQAELPAYQAALARAPGDRLRLEVSEDLQNGQVRVVCDNGGVLFSDKDCLEKVESIISSAVSTQ